MYEFESIAHVDPVVTEVELQGESTQVTGRIDFPPPPPQMEFPPGQWSQNTQGIWNQYGEPTTSLPPVLSDPQLWRPPAVAVPQP